MATADNKGSEAASYKVIGQRPDAQLGAAGGFVQGVTINIQTAAGHSGQVFVPDSQYTREQVQPVLRKLAAELDAIGNLTD